MPQNNSGTGVHKGLLASGQLHIVCILFSSSAVPIIPDLHNIINHCIQYKDRACDFPRMCKYAKMMRPSINIRGQQEAGGQAGIPDTRTGEMQGCSVSPDGGNV